MYSQQLTVEDPDDSRTLWAVGGSAALAFLEGCWQLLDLIPLTSVLQRNTGFHTPRQLGRLAKGQTVLYTPHAVHNMNKNERQDKEKIKS